MLLKHGSILFRGFQVGGVPGFHDAVAALSDGALEYKFRASPRTQVDQERHIYTSTDYPAEESIFVGSAVLAECARVASEQK